MDVQTQLTVMISVITYTASDFSVYVLKLSFLFFFSFTLEFIEKLLFCFFFFKPLFLNLSYGDVISIASTLLEKI